MSTAEPPLDFAPFVAQARDLLDGFHREAGPPRGGFASRAGGEADLYGAADAAYALFVLGELEERTTPDDRHAWAERIRRHQDPATGWFRGPFLPGHGAPHATAFATGALRLLGSRPAHPLRYAERLFASRASIDGWLDGFRWSQIWTGSHAAGAAAAALDAPEGLALPAGWTSWLLDALAERVDPATGFWKRALHDRLIRRPTTLDLGGAAHFWWLFDRCGRAIPYPERALTGVLGLQRRSGLWGSRLFGGAFPQGIDFDALHGLRVAWRDAEPAAREARRAGVAGALDRYARVAHAMLSPPGAVARLFGTPHKLVGTLDALAELERATQAILGRSGIATPRPLRSALGAVSWQ